MFLCDYQPLEIYFFLLGAGGFPGPGGPFAGPFPSVLTTGGVIALALTMLSVTHALTANDGKMPPRAPSRSSFVSVVIVSLFNNSFLLAWSLLMFNLLTW